MTDSREHIDFRVDPIGLTNYIFIVKILQFLKSALCPRYAVSFYHLEDLLSNLLETFFYEKCNGLLKQIDFEDLIFHPLLKYFLTG